MRLGLDHDQTHRMVRPVFRLALQSHPHQRVAHHARLQCLLAQQPFLLDLEEAVLLDAADVTAGLGVNLVEQLELAEPPVHHIAAVTGQLLSQHGFFIAFTGVPRVGQFHVRGNEIIKVELNVQLPGVLGRAILERQPHRRGDGGDGVQDRAVHQRQRVIEMGF